MPVEWSVGGARNRPYSAASAVITRMPARSRPARPRLPPEITSSPRGPGCPAAAATVAPSLAGVLVVTVEEGGPERGRLRCFPAPSGSHVNRGLGHLLLAADP